MRRRCCVRAPSRRGGFSLLEVLVVIGIITILLGLVLAFVNKTWAVSQSASCKKNLQQIASALGTSARDHGDSRYLTRSP